MVIDFFDKCRFKGLAGLEDWCCFGVSWMAEGFGFWIVSAGEDEGVEAGDEGGDGVWVGRGWREDDGDGTGVVDGLGVGHGEVGGGMIFADHEIGGDGDEGFGLGGSHVVCFVGCFGWEWGGMVE